MQSLTRDQLQSVVNEIDRATEKHQSWYESLLRVLICHLPPQENDLAVDAEQRCLFGQWCNSPDAGLIIEHETFKALARAHKNMHDSCRMLLEHMIQRQMIPVELLDSFTAELADMRVQFESLRHEFSERISNLDPLTGANTRAGLMAILNKEHSLSVRGYPSASILMIDLDYFKSVNDTYGHSVGDKVLVSTVESIQKTLRPYDSLYRLGGEEFLVCLPSTDMEQASIIAERIRESISTTHIKLEQNKQSIRVTASLGVASLCPERNVVDSIELADKAMYLAKQEGRDLVKVA
ncbi:MAG TPA: diguanylate cyclase [Methylophaga aminisulfidivorans]|uniref:diguanylate cyclase n=2 Tax=root TaxID=1 RepID=A0A7C1VX33_9GAMM|nr:diguanylate cyclase [Methylophaga aminisulfidivorans]